MTSCIPRWFTRTQMVTHTSFNTAAHGRESNSQPVDHESDALTTTLHVKRGDVPVTSYPRSRGSFLMPAVVAV